MKKLTPLELELLGLDEQKTKTSEALARAGLDQHARCVAKLPPLTEGKEAAAAWGMALRASAAACAQDPYEHRFLARSAAAEQVRRLHLACFDLLGELVTWQASQEQAHLRVEPTQVATALDRDIVQAVLMNGEKR